MTKKAYLTIYGQGEVEVDLIRSYLTDVLHAYNSILVFETLIDNLLRLPRDLTFALHWSGLVPGWPLIARGRKAVLRDWPPAPAEIALLVPRSDQLVLASVHLTSPGKWKFNGVADPFEVIRKYLNDRHERRKDREYRESAEKRRLLLENLQRETDVIASRIRLAKDIGATERDLAPLLNELINRPVIALDRHQDSDVIERAEISDLPGHEDEEAED